MKNNQLLLKMSMEFNKQTSLILSKKEIYIKDYPKNEKEWEFIYNLKKFDIEKKRKLSRFIFRF